MASSTGSTVIVVHGGCADGYTSAGLLLRKLPGARVVYAQPAELRAELERIAPQAPARLVIADLSPQQQDRDAIMAVLSALPNASVTWLDHHAPQWPAEFEAALNKCGFEVVVDRAGRESGASLSAKWTQEKDPAILRVADLIRRRDAWTDPHDAEARAWTLVAGERGPEFVHRLAEGRLGGLEEEGRQLLAAQERNIERSLSEVGRFNPAVAYLWSEEDVSDVADRLFQKDPAVVYLLRFGPSRRVSIRSRPGRPVAAALAQRFGGGGHEHAAGFTLRLSWSHRVALRLRRTSAAPVRAVLAAAGELALEPRPVPGGAPQPSKK